MRESCRVRNGPVHERAQLSPRIGFVHEVENQELLCSRSEEFHDRIISSAVDLLDGIRVSDDGCGISTSDQSRLFEPFFTTKPVGQGTGLGLSVSYEIARSHDGEIVVTSAPGEGATFELRLPLADEPAT